MSQAWRAERLATTRTRIASTAPSLDLGLPLARPLRAARAASTASRGSDLPARRRSSRLGRSTSMTSTPARRRNRERPAPSIRCLPHRFGSSPRTRARPVAPCNQRSWSRSAPCQQPAERVERGGHMDVEVRIDTTGHPTRSFYDGHGHPFSLCVEGWHGRSGSERRAAQVVGSNPGQSPQLGDGTCRCQCMQLEKLGRRRLATSRDSKSDRTRQHSRSYLGPAIKRWILREVSMYWGSHHHNSKTVGVWYELGAPRWRTARAIPAEARSVTRGSVRRRVTAPPSSPCRTRTLRNDVDTFG